MSYRISSTRPMRRPIAPKKVNDYRIPNEEPLVPRLRELDKDLDCVGFVHHFGSNDE